MIFPSEHDFALFLFQLFILLSLALTLGEVFRRFGQPTVIGEILAGILLGPSVLGSLSPSLWSTLFPGPQTQLLGSLAWFGSVFLLLVAGTEVNVATLHREGRTVLYTAVLGIFVPFVVGLLFALWLPDQYLVDPSRRWVFALFLATAMSISAIPVVAKILIDLKLMTSTVGHIIMGSAILNDLIGWMFFAVILSLISGAVAQQSVVGIIFLTVGFSVLCLTIGRGITARVFAFFHARQLPPEGILGLAILIAFFCAALTSWIGIHAIFGAFLAGVMIGETGEIKSHSLEILRNIVLSIFAPIFFATMGLRANFLAHFDLGLVLGVLAIACTGKIVGGTLGAYLGGMKWYSALSVGFGLNARGAMEIILAFLALEYGLINEKVFVALVITAVATSIMGGPLIKWALAREPAQRGEMRTASLH